MATFEVILEPSGISTSGAVDLGHFARNDAVAVVTVGGELTMTVIPPQWSQQAPVTATWTQESPR